MKKDTKKKKKITFVAIMIIITVVLISIGIIICLLGASGIIKNKKLQRKKLGEKSEESNIYVAGNRNSLDIVECGSNENNTSFYVMYKSGLIYQWGTVDKIEKDYKEIRFPKSFSNTEYVVQLSKKIEGNTSMYIDVTANLNYKGINIVNVKKIENTQIVSFNEGVVEWMAFGY